MTQPPEPRRSEILALVKLFADQLTAGPAFVPGLSQVPVSGRTFDADDVMHLVDASLDFWLTSGRFAGRFEQEFAGFLGRRHAVLCNSGSSANLLAVSSLTSPKLGDRRLAPGDEVITVAAGFPTTVNPLLQNRLVPVLIDLEPLDQGTYNADVQQLEQARSPRTRAVMMAHTLGNPYRLDEVVDFVNRHDLWLIEDNCDALGSAYDGRLTGTFGDLSTFSFYPAHHITMGEGGCVVVQRGSLSKLVKSFRDWGRDCWCEPGQQNTCGKRFEWQLGELPCGYDHKYIFSHIGYNLKITDMQAAVGVAQLKKLPAFIQARRRNFAMLYEALLPLEEFFVLPTATPKSDPSWFGFPLSVRAGAPFTRQQLIAHLDSRNIATRTLFAGNLTRQPAYQDSHFRIPGELSQTDQVMERSFWLGVYPGITEPMISFVAGELSGYCKGVSKPAAAVSRRSR